MFMCRLLSTNNLVKRKRLQFNQDTVCISQYYSEHQCHVIQIMHCGYSSGYSLVLGFIKQICKLHDELQCKSYDLLWTDGGLDADS